MTEPRWLDLSERWFRLLLRLYPADFRDEIVDMKKAVDDTMAALDKIVAQATVDPRKAFKEFDRSIPDIDSAAKKAKKRADDMRERGKEYFEKWEKDLNGVKDPDIRVGVRIISSSFVRSME